MHDSPVVAVEVLGDRLVGKEGGFLAIRRLDVRNRRADGSVSAQYLVDYVIRPKGIDAVVVAIWCRLLDRIRVLVRDGLRPPIHFGRPQDQLPLPDPKPYLFSRELVAGIIEHGERGEDAVRARAAAEVYEEAGFVVDPSVVTFLGQGSFPSPGAMSEKYIFCSVEIPEAPPPRPPAGDGSPYEEGATTFWMDLDEAIAACEAGEIEDAKTEIALRRLRARLG
jgi:ADP-ribose pyrophosphatase